MATTENAKKALNAIDEINRSLEGEGMELDLENEFGEHVITYGDARKITKAKKYTSVLIVSHWRNIYGPNDKKILEILSNAAQKNNDDSEAVIVVNEDPLIKVTAKFMKLLTQKVSERIAHMKNYGDESDDIKGLKDILKLLKSASKAPPKAKKDADKTEKIAEAKANVSALKKIASDAKKVADAAQKKYENAEAALAKLKM